MGAAFGQWLDDKNWDFLGNPVVEPWFHWAIVAACLWLLLSVTKSYWHPSAVVSSKDEQMLLTQLGGSARSIADSVGTPMQARRQFVRGELVVHLVNNLSRVYSKIPDVRAIVYELNAEQNRLTPIKHAGERKPRGDFTLDDDRGRAAIDFVLGDNGAELVSDVKKDGRPGWNGSGNGYRTYIAAPIVSKSGFHGMITIDAPRPGDLTHHDKRVIDLAASILSVGFAHTKK